MPRNRSEKHPFGHLPASVLEFARLRAIDNADRDGWGSGSDNPCWGTHFWDVMTADERCVWSDLESVDQRKVIGHYTAQLRKKTP